MTGAMNLLGVHPLGCSRRPGALTLKWFACALCLLGFGGVGCRSAGPSSAKPFASVEIKGNTPGQIHDVAVEVFREHGYKLAKPGLTRLVFERQGSTMDNLAYGNWIGDTPVWVRVKASIVPVAEAVFRLQCEAFLVRDAGSPIIEEEIKISHLRSGPYQKILDEVARRFGAKPGAKNAAGRNPAAGGLMQPRCFVQAKAPAREYSMGPSPKVYKFEMKPDALCSANHGRLAKV